MSPVRDHVALIGTRDGPEEQRLRDFLTRIAQPFDWHESGSPATGELLAERVGTDVELPVVAWDDGLLPAATVEQLAEAWDMRAPPARDTYDLVVVGAGPAGLAAAVYASADGLATLLVEENVPGGQASHTALIENFFGFPEGIGGAELARLAGRQAERFGTELTLMRGVTGHSVGDDGAFRMDVAGGHTVSAPIVVAAPGIDWRRIEAPGVEELLGRGVHYGAGRAEARHCQGDDVVVVGAGNSAGQAATYLAEMGARVTILVRGEDLGKSMSAYLINRVRAHERIDVRLRTRLESARGAESLEAVVVRGPEDASEELPARALFLCLGGLPRSGWAAGSGVRTDRRGYVLTGPDLLEAGRRPGGWPLDRDPLALETSVPGLFAAGDVRSGSTKRVAGAVGEGAMAVALAHVRMAEIGVARR